MAREGGGPRRARRREIDPSPSLSPPSPVHSPRFLFSQKYIYLIIYCYSWTLMLWIQNPVASTPRKEPPHSPLPKSFATPLLKSNLSIIPSTNHNSTPNKFYFEVPLPFSTPSSPSPSSLPHQTLPTNKTPSSNPFLLEEPSDEANSPSLKKVISTKKRSADEAIIGGDAQLKKKSRTYLFFPLSRLSFSIQALFSLWFHFFVLVRLHWFLLNTLSRWSSSFLVQQSSPTKPSPSWANGSASFPPSLSSILPFNSHYSFVHDRFDEFWCNLGEDLGAFSRHAKRSTIQPEDVELFLKRFSPFLFRYSIPSF